MRIICNNIVQTDTRTIRDERIVPPTHSPVDSHAQHILTSATDALFHTEKLTFVPPNQDKVMIISLFSSIKSVCDNLIRSRKF